MAGHDRGRVFRRIITVLVALSVAWGVTTGLAAPAMADPPVGGGIISDPGNTPWD
ncbi:hypothetical protein [Streptosporangium sp. KLBMP 9127]|nr:hypothetical protein [Streptosporangium sp. KLBMP 9127]